MTISLKSDAGGTFGEILVNGSQVAKFTPGGNAVIAGLVGTVSQSGGVPTGAVVERGSNANGEFVRFADGTQICTLIATPTIAINLAFFGGFASAAQLWTYPAVFSAIPFVAASAGGGTAFGTAFGSITATSCDVLLTSVSTQPASSRAEFFTAIGRWF